MSVYTKERSNRRIENQVRILLAAGLIDTRKRPETPLLPPPKEAEKSKPKRNWKEGFDPVAEAHFLGQIEDIERRKSTLKMEVVSQIAEDVGLIEHIGNFDYTDGEIFVPGLGKKLSDIVRNGGNDDELIALGKIEEGLKEEGVVMVHFSPDNEDLAYKYKFVDFWRIVGGKAQSIRLMVKNNGVEMKGIWKVMNGLKREDPIDVNLLSSPVKSHLKLAELIEFVDLENKKNNYNYGLIEQVADQISGRLEKRFGDKLMSDPELIFRLYSAVYHHMEVLGKKGLTATETRIIVEKYWLDSYAESRIIGVLQKKSYGCSGSTQVGEFGQGLGLIIKMNSDGGMSIEKGSTEGMKLCRKCGLYYEGDYCPICDKPKS